MIETFLLPAISLGLSACLLPGPMQAFLINTYLAYGWRRGIVVIFSPLLIDPPIILIVVFLLGQLPDAVIQLIRLVGGIFLVWIARGAWLQFRAGAGIGDHAAAQQSPGSARRILLTAMTLNLLSPGPYLFWTTVNGPLLIKALGESPLHALAFLAGFYITFLGGLALLGYLVARLGGLDPRINRLIMLVVILLMIWFGASLIGEALGAVAVARLIVSAALILMIGWILLQNQRQKAPSTP